MPKGWSEATNRRKADNTMVKRKRTKGQTLTYKTLLKNQRSRNMYPTKKPELISEAFRKGQQFMHSGTCRKEKWKECRWIVNYKTRHLGCMKYVRHWKIVQWLWDVDYIVQVLQLSLCFWSLINVKINWYQFEFKHIIYHVGIW